MTNHEKERLTVREVKVGLDAGNTPWTIDSRSNDPMFPTHPEAREEAFRLQHLTLPLPPRQIGKIALASTSAQLPGFVPPPAKGGGGGDDEKRQPFLHGRASVLSESADTNGQSSGIRGTTQADAQGTAR